MKPLQMRHFPDTQYRDEAFRHVYTDPYGIECIYASFTHNPREAKDSALDSPTGCQVYKVGSDGNGELVADYPGRS